MTFRLANLTLDCDDTLAVAELWAAALERDLDDGASELFASGSGRPSLPTWTNTDIGGRSWPMSRETNSASARRRCSTRAHAVNLGQSALLLIGARS